jgi:hypothetical protein
MKLKQLGFLVTGKRSVLFKICLCLTLFFCPWFWFLFEPRNKMSFQIPSFCLMCGESNFHLLFSQSFLTSWFCILEFRPYVWREILYVICHVFSPLIGVSWYCHHRFWISKDLTKLLVVQWMCRNPDCVALYKDWKWWSLINKNMKIHLIFDFYKHIMSTHF